MTDQFDTGVVTVMFTDVEGSTDLTRRLGDEAARRTIESHKRIVREALAEHGGREIDSIGDGFMITFLSTRRAIACAVSIHKALAAHAGEHPDEEVRVRIGLNVGEVLERGGHPFGAAVNATQRVGAYAKGGQIFVSEPVRHLAGTMPDVSFRDRGRFTLKGFSERWRLFEVIYDAPAKAPPKPQPAADPAARRRRRALLGAAGAGAAALALVAFLLLRGGTETLDRVAANSVGIIDPGSGDIVGEVGVGKSPVAITYDEENGRLWVANLGAATISEIDPESRTLEGTFGVGSGASGVAAGEGAVWVANQFADQVSVFDPAQGSVTHRIDVDGPRDIAVGFGAVWVASRTNGAILRIDPQTREDEQVARGTTLALGEDAVWVADGTKLTRLDPQTTKPVGRPFTLRLVADHVTVDEDGTVWVTHTTDDAVSRVDPGDGTQQTIEDVGDDPTGIAAGAGSIWVASSLGAALIRIGTESRSVEDEIALGASPEAIVVADGRVWVTTVG